MLPPLIEQIFLAGRHAASADNTQPWHFIWTGKYIEIRFARDRINSMTFNAGNPATLLGIGSVIENMDQACRFLGLASKWELLSGSKEGAYAKVFVGSPNSAAGTERDQIPLFGRHTNRLGFKPTPLPEQIGKRISAMVEGSARPEIIENSDVIREVGDFVYHCSEVRFQTKEIHEWLGDSLRFTNSEVERGDGLDVATLDLPPGGAFFLRIIKDWRHMSLFNKVSGYKLLAQLEAKPIRQARTLVGIVAENSQEERINAGRLMTRLWIELNAQQIAVQPFYVIPDQIHRLNEGSVPPGLEDKIASVATRSRGIFKLQQDEQVYMLLRVGYPKSKPTKSRRLPLENLYTDLTSSSHSPGAKVS